MKIKTTESIKDLKGISIKNGDSDFTIGNALSIILLDSKEGDRFKLYNLFKFNNSLFITIIHLQRKNI